MEEPAGSEGCPCLLVKKTEYVFNVATANGPAFHSPTTQGLRGIDAPYELKKDVWSMKRGQGIAGKLVDALIDTARAQGWKVIPRCSYVVAAFRRHPEWNDVLAD